MVSSSQAFGQRAEKLSERLLRKKGYRIIEKNIRLAGGELDLIAEDHGTLVFIEVKARRGNQFGGSPYAITTHKKRQLTKLAQFYLSQKKLRHKQCRFDAILISETTEHPPQLTHIEDAFEVPSSDWQW